MKTFKIIGIDPLHYEEIKYETFINWGINNTNTPAECQMCLSDKGMQNYFKKHFASLEINFVTHLQMFRKPQSVQDRLDLFFTYLKRFDCHFPKALKPKVKPFKPAKGVRYEYN